MAPTSSLLFPRQKLDNNDDFFKDRNDRDNERKFWFWPIIVIVFAVAIIGLIAAFILFRRDRQRRRAINSVIDLITVPNKPATPNPAASDPTKYAGAPGGYTATSDQNQSLLGHAEAPAIVMWDSSTNDNAAAHSTQDGFGYDNNLHLAGAIQRPASIASFAAPPPRYEEATSSNASLRLQIQGKAANHFNAGNSVGEERGRSRSRDGAARERALSVDQRSINGDRRRSISRFREEGMDNVNVDRS